MEKRHTRRDFIHNMSFTVLGTMGLGVFIQSCAEKGVTFSKDLAKIYIESIIKIIKLIKERELPKIEQAVGLAVQAKLQGKNLYAHLTGSMIQGEMDIRRPGNPNIFITEDLHRASREDFVLTNDANAARGLCERLVKVVGLTSPSTPNAKTPPDSLENMGMFRIEDVSDIVIYCHVPHTDGIINVEGIDIPLFPASGVIHTLIYYSVVSDMMEELARHGVYYTTV